MRKILIITLLLVLSLTLSAQRNWKIYTNTTHIYDVEQIDDQLLLATWGGLLNFDLTSDSFVSTKTIIDGYSSNDLTCVDYNEISGVISVGSKFEGINRLLDDEFVMPLSEILGLASNSVRDIIHNDSLLIVATFAGLSVFADVEGFPFPVLIANFTTENGLSDNNIKALALTDNGYIVCGTDEGLDYVHVDSLTMLNSFHNLTADNSPLPSSTINSLSVKAGDLLIGTTNGIALVDFPQLENWVIYDDSYFGEEKSIYPVYLAEDRSMWFSFGIWNDDEITVIDSSEIAIVQLKANEEYRFWLTSDLPVNTNKIMKFCELDDGELIALTWGEGFLINDGNNWISKNPNSIVASLVKEIEVDGDGKLWACNGYIPPPTNTLLPKGTAGVSCYDGEMWTNFTSKNSPLHSDNIFSLEIDSQNRVWMGAWYIGDNLFGWYDGIGIYDQSTTEWSFLSTSDGLRNDAISSLYEDDNERMWSTNYGGSTGGISVIDVNSLEVINDFELYQSTGNLKDPLKVFVAEDKIYFGGLTTGIRIWNSDSTPYDNGPYWELPSPTDLRTGYVFAIDSSLNNDKEEIWIASAKGLFSYSWTNYFDTGGEYLWNKYGTIIKKKAWRNGVWFDEATPEFWYIEGQERIFGSVPTFPTALFVDPFNRVWIGTNDNGISVYDLNSETFTNYNMANSPLVSNLITDFAYDEFTGTLYIGTNEGLNSVEIGISADYNTELLLNKVITYPNPFYPEKGEVVRIENKNKLTMPKGDTKCFIYDLSGELIVELEKNIFEQFSWDGDNEAGKQCSSGIYLFVVTAPDGTSERGKIALIR